MGSEVCVEGLLAILWWVAARVQAVRRLPVLPVHQDYLRTLTHLWTGTCCCGEPFGAQTRGRGLTLPAPSRETPGMLLNVLPRA